METESKDDKWDDCLIDEYLQAQGVYNETSAGLKTFF